MRLPQRVVKDALNQVTASPQRAGRSKRLGILGAKKITLSVDANKLTKLPASPPLTASAAATQPPEPPEGTSALRRSCPPLAFGHRTLLPHFRAICSVHETGAGSERGRRDCRQTCTGGWRSPTPRSHLER